MKHKISAVGVAAVRRLEKTLTPGQLAALDAAALRYAAAAGLVAAGAASAEVTTLDMTGGISAFGTYMQDVITTNSPALFGILGLAVGFFFLWGRIRALF